MESQEVIQTQIPDENLLRQLYSSQKELDQIDSNAFKEFKSFNHPNFMVVCIAQSIILLLDVKPIISKDQQQKDYEDYWGTFQKVTKDSNFIKKITQIDIDNITPQSLLFISQLAQDQQYQSLPLVSVAAACIYKWLVAIVNYSKISKQIRKKFPNYKFTFRGELKDEHEIVEEDEFHHMTKKEQGQLQKKKQYDDDIIEYDEEMGALFQKVLPGEGDEFSSVKPWLGAIKEPKNHPQPNPKAPAEEFEIDWIYGYRSEEARMNCQFNNLGYAVYPAAAVGVIFDFKNMNQLYFGGGLTGFGGRKQKDTTANTHNDDVTALTISQSRQIVATGQNGQEPLIYVWSAENASLFQKKKLPKGSRLVTGISISNNDKYICASDAAEKITVHIFQMDGPEYPIASVGINMKVSHLIWHPNLETQFASVGKDHLMVCTFDGKSTVKSVKGKSKETISHTSAAWFYNNQYKDLILTAGGDGNIYVWKEDQILTSAPNNQGAVQSLACRVNEKYGEIILAGGNDKTLTLYTFNGKLNKIWAVEVLSAPRSIDLFQNTILLGLKNGSIVQMPLSEDGKGKQISVMTSHCDGEVWGLEIVTLDDGSLRILTSADDNRILAYNGKTHQALCEGKIAEPGKKKASKPKRGGASTMSSMPEESQSRCIAYNASLKQLAVAANNGIVTIRDIDWSQIDKKQAGSLDKIKTTLFSGLKNAEWIETMAFSPCNNYLAVGSHDNNIYIIDTKTYKQQTKLTGHSSFITGLDWSIDSKFIRSVCGAYELLFFNIPTKKRDASGPANTVESIWCDQTCKFGWNVQGIFPPGCDGSHINSVCMTKDQKLIASGDDYGLVCVYRNPLLDGHKSNKYRGHSEHVTHVKFSDDSKYLFSTGGQDQTTIQWRKIKN